MYRSRRAALLAHPAKRSCAQVSLGFFAQVLLGLCTLVTSRRSCHVGPCKTVPHMHGPCGQFSFHRSLHTGLRALVLGPQMLAQRSFQKHVPSHSTCIRACRMLAQRPFCYTWSLAQVLSASWGKIHLSRSLHAGPFTRIPAHRPRRRGSQAEVLFAPVHANKSFHRDHFAQLPARILSSLL